MAMAIMEERARYGEAEMSRVLEEREKLAIEEYGIVQSNAGYYGALAELNKIVGLPDYFRSEHERSGYERWKKAAAEQEVYAAPVNMPGGNARAVKKHWFWDLFSGKK
jgi:hypothetical protein